MIEIQIHPSDIRRRVRFYFVNRKTIRTAVVLSSVLLGLVVGSIAAAPFVFRRAYKTNDLRVVRSEWTTRTAALDRNLQEIAKLERELDEQQVRVEKLVAVYGLDMSRSWQGGLSAGAPTSGSAALRLADARAREKQLRRSVALLQRQIDILARHEVQNAELVRHVPAILPLPAHQFVLTSPFGSRVSPFTRTSHFHKGLDLAAPTGTPVYASADGVVTFAGRYPMHESVAWWRFGNVVVVNHAGRFLSIYGHCDTVNVRAGQRIRQGETIATVGSTGWSTNSHLHYEIRSDLETPGKYEPIDPRIYILDYGWENEAKLIRGRRSKEYKDFDPLPSVFVGKG